MDSLTITNMKDRPRSKSHKARPSNQTVPKQLLILLEEQIPGFSYEKYAFEIAWLLWCSIDPARAHRAHEGAVWMHTDELRRLFGEVRYFAKANRDSAFRYFYVLRHLNGTESPKDSHTNGYKPKPWMQKAVDWVIREGQSLDFVDAGGKSRRIHSLAICSTDSRGSVVQRWKGVNVPALIPVNVENLRVLLCKWECLIDSRQQPKVFLGLLERYGLKQAGLARAHRQTQALIAEAQGSRHPSMLPIRYVLHETGRLYAEGLNLQSCKREIRQAALAGYWDVDISTCHFAIMAQMARRFGMSCPSIEDYVSRKNDVRGQIARDIGVSLRESKKMINAVGYGAPRSTSLYTEIPKQVGRAKAQAFFDHPLYLGIKADVDAATAVILEKYPSQRNALINHANRSIPTTDEKGGKAKDGTLLAHLLQGVEAAALEAAVRACDGKVVLLQHDGFTSTEPIDPEYLRGAVLKETGYDLGFEVEPIKMPLADFDVFEDSLNKKLKNPLNPTIHADSEPFWPCFSGTVALCRCDVPPVFPLPLVGSVPF